MMLSMDSAHRDRILDQFTRQAVPFSQARNIRNREALDRIVQIAEAGPDDTVLDVACGPGLLTCAFAHVTHHATGIDITPAMLDQARNAQKQQGLTNVTWELGDVLSLPWPDRHFSIVATRFSFHHLQDPRAALKEMQRVTKTGGRIVVADMAPSPDKADRLNQMERLRDPSHVRAMPVEELSGLFAAAGLLEPRIDTYRLEGELEDLLERSFPNEGDADRIRRMFEESLSTDSLDLSTHRKDGQIFFSYPVAILATSV